MLSDMSSTKTLEQKKATERSSKGSSERKKPSDDKDKLPSSSSEKKKDPPTNRWKKLEEVESFYCKECDVRLIGREMGELRFYLL